MDWQEVVKTATILILILDPFGNALVFNSILSAHTKKRRAWIIFRELVFALVFLIGFLIAGEKILSYLGLTQYALSIAGGVLLFMISLKMIFPAVKIADAPEAMDEPFIVPLAMPLVAGPSVIAVLLLMQFKQSRQYHTICDRTFWRMGLHINYTDRITFYLGLPGTQNVKRARTPDGNDLGYSIRSNAT
ncbi:inner membrane protein YhgN [Roseibium sp. TrichSKD4]|nr:MarC family protein [Roseibium sp. TrichSKD4]EFO33459.1 inner membrane protein YhgN [Roseibium sp. TrichSKD4]